MNWTITVLQCFLTKIATNEYEIDSLRSQVNEGVKQGLDLIDQHMVTERSLQQRNEILQEEVDSTKGLLETQNQRVQELETALHALNEDIQSKERQPLQVRPLVLENGKSKPNGKQNGVIENTKPKSNVLTEKRTTNGLLEKATPPKPVHEKRTSENRTPSKLVAEKQTPNKVSGKRTPSKLLPEKQTPNKVPGKRTPSKLVPEKQTPNKVPGKRTPSKLVREKPWR
jgi:hypothetical protein